MTTRRPADDEKAILVTGGAGFVGANLAKRLMDEGHTVIVLDNLERPGVGQNLEWLRETHPNELRFVPGDVRDPVLVRRALRGVSEVYHCAAQVAVTTSIADPMEDFSVNLAGTLNLLEAMRECPSPPKLLFTSTNKVYGGLAELDLAETETRWVPRDEVLREFGVGEDYPISFASPYGCSKGAADQYVLDYARTFGLPATVFRMSCIYGPRQLGTEDQGWIAHFVSSALNDETITVYGDGKQVRDVLFVDDLVDAMLLARRYFPRLAGQAFNVGGGPSCTISLLDLLSSIGRLERRAPKLVFAPWRLADQRYYVSDTRRFQRLTPWKPKIHPGEGVERLHHWLRRARPGLSPGPELMDRGP
jgi:CDP-paratose 2-epimerase